MDFITINCRIPPPKCTTTVTIAINKIVCFYDDMNTTVIILNDGTKLETTTLVATDLKKHIRSIGNIAKIGD